MRKTRAFTLVELLVVTGLIVLLSVLAVPSITGIVSGSAVTRASQLVEGQFILARQEATGRNREVQVRFIRQKGGPGPYSGVQLWVPSARDVTQYRPLSPVAWLPAGTRISSDATLSPLVQAPTISLTNGETLPERGQTEYCGFRFRSGGGTDMAFNSAANFVTVVRETDASTSTPPANYAVVQVDPVNGRVRTYRP